MTVPDHYELAAQEQVSVGWKKLCVFPLSIKRIVLKMHLRPKGRRPEGNGDEDGETCRTMSFILLIWTGTLYFQRKMQLLMGLRLLGSALTGKEGQES